MSDDSPLYENQLGFRVVATESLPRFQSALDELLDVTRIPESGVQSFFIFGSFVYGSFTGAGYKDVDIVGGSATDREILRPFHGARFHTRCSGRSGPIKLDVNPRVFTTPYQLLNRTDFTVTQAVYSYSDNHVYLAPELFEHQANRILVSTPIPGELPLQSILRTYKYLLKGYQCPEETLLTLFGTYKRRSRVKVLLESLYFLRAWNGGLVPDRDGS